jgi:hypothetical protein
MTLDRRCPTCYHPEHDGIQLTLRGFCPNCPDCLEYPDEPEMAPDLPGGELDDYDLVTDDVDVAADSDLREWVANRLERAIAPETELELRAAWGDR